jgi:hypothetical protein
MQIIFEEQKQRAPFDGKHDHLTQKRRGEISGVMSRLRCIQARIDSGFINNAEGRKHEKRAIKALQFIGTMGLVEYSDPEQVKCLRGYANKNNISLMQAFFMKCVGAFRKQITTWLTRNAKNPVDFLFWDLNKLWFQSGFKGNLKGNTFDELFNNLQNKLEDAVKTSPEPKILSVGIQPNTVPCSTHDNDVKCLGGQSKDSEYGEFSMPELPKVKEYTFTPPEYKSLMVKLKSLPLKLRTLAIGALASKKKALDSDAFERVYNKVLDGKAHQFLLSISPNRRKSNGDKRDILYWLSPEQSEERIAEIIYS